MIAHSGGTNHDDNDSNAAPAVTYGAGALTALSDLSVRSMLSAE